MILHEDRQEESDWGTQLGKIYAEELESNTEDALWVNQKNTYIETPVDEELERELEDSEWGQEMARLYSQVL